MNKLFKTFLFLILFSFGCSLSTQNKAILTANEIHEIANAESEVINNYCIPKYQSAKTQEEFKKIDDICAPAEISYDAVKVSWIALAILLGNPKATEKDIQTATIKLVGDIA